MNSATIDMFNEQLHTALILLTSNKQVCKDLAHYIADNGISKIMMLTLVESGKQKQADIEKLHFPTLVSTFEREFPSISVDYKEIIRQHSGARNPFQHRIETTYLGIRPEQATLYVNLLQQLMDQLGIYKKSEDFTLGIDDPNAIYFDKLAEEFTSIVGQARTSFHTDLLSKLSAVVAKILARAPRISWWARRKVNQALYLYQRNPLIEDRYMGPFIFHRLDEIPIIIAPYVLRKRKQKI